MSPGLGLQASAPGSPQVVRPAAVQPGPVQDRPGRVLQRGAAGHCHGRRVLHLQGPGRPVRELPVPVLPVVLLRDTGEPAAELPQRGQEVCRV